MGLLKMSEKYSAVRLEAACQKALQYTDSPSYKSIRNILVTWKEQPVAPEKDVNPTHNEHALTRGAEYYGRKGK